MKRQVGLVVLLVALVSAFTIAPMRASAATKDKNFLKNVPVSGTLADGGSFVGKLTITKVGYDAVEGLTISGELKGKAREADGTATNGIKQSFENVPATLSQSASTSAFAAQAIQPQATCDVLFLDLGPLSLDLLGLTVDLSQVILDINAVSGAGNLLGNLLCGIVGLLDPATGLLNLLENLNTLLGLLGQLNNLLG